jgi:hypothetical protein
MKSYTNKNGDIKEYDQKEYNKRYYEKHRDSILGDKYLCECCNKEVNIRNKTNHDNTLKHRLYLQIKNNQS